MQPDLVIQRTLQDVHDLLPGKHAATRNWSDERTVLSMHVIVGKDDVRQALEKANDTAPCFALHEVKYVLEQRSEDHDRSPVAHHQTVWAVRQTKPSGDLLVEEAVDRLTTGSVGGLAFGSDRNLSRSSVHVEDRLEIACC